MKEIRCIKNGLKALESRQKFNHTLWTTFIFSICNFQYFVFFPTQNKLWMPLPFFVILSRGRLKGKSIRRGAKMPMYGVKNSNTEGRGASQLWTTMKPKLLWNLNWNLTTFKKWYFIPPGGTLVPKYTTRSVPNFGTSQPNIDQKRILYASKFRRKS